MLEGIRKMIVGMQQEGLRVDMLAQNLANSETAGYMSTGVGSRAQGFEAWLQSRQGPVSTTNRPLDVAFPAGVYLAVETPDGKRYVRRGDLTVRGDGVLTTGDGLVVLGGEGGPLRVVGGNPSVAANGSVWAGGKRAGTLGLFRLPSVVETGGTLFTPSEGVDPQAVSNPSLMVGALEGPNVDVVREMTDITSAVRRTSALQGFAKIQDATLGAAISELGRSR